MVLLTVRAREKGGEQIEKHSARSSVWWKSVFCTDALIFRHGDNNNIVIATHELRKRVVIERFVSPR